MTASDWVTAVIASAALVVSIWAAFSSQRSAKHANAAAVLSANASVRAADAAERQTEIAEEARAAYRVPWVIEHKSGSMHRLVNDGDEAAKNVAIQVRYGVDEPQSFMFPTIDARSSVEFVAHRVHGQVKIRVLWVRPVTGEEKSWEYPL
ncbi:hypothetical protein SAMN05444157_1600 [Frankineae bacterium MT45]|nr:hypothetical protein SAMN05444157_1600 [Frankineae bacterium MT45]